MSCDRANQIDLAGLLAGEDTNELRAFRRHLSECPECAAALNAWADLDRQLRSEATAPTHAHPSEEALLRFHDRPTSLPPAERQAVQDHVAACPTCRDELRALESFDFPSLVAQEARTSAPRRSAAEWIRQILGRLRPVVLHPAFACGLVALLVARLLTIEAERQSPFHLPTETADRAVSPRVVPPEAKQQLPLPEEREEASAAPAAPPERLAAHEVAAPPSAPAPPAPPAPPANERKAKASTAPLAGSVPARSPATAPDPARQRGAGSSAASRDEVGKSELFAAAPGRDATFPPALHAVPQSTGRLEKDVAASREVGSVLGSEPGMPVHLARDKTVEIVAPSPGQQITLLVPLPPDRSDGAQVEITLRRDNDGAEIHERLAVAPGSGEVALDVPSAWLRSGAYVVDARTGPTRERFTFLVR